MAGEKSSRRTRVCVYIYIYSEQIWRSVAESRVGIARGTVVVAEIFLNEMSTRGTKRVHSNDDDNNNTTTTTTIGRTASVERRDEAAWPRRRRRSGGGRV